jgi:hypothetical protein
MLYQPLISPVHATASLYASLFGSVVPKTDSAMDSDTYCQYTTSAYHWSR